MSDVPESESLPASVSLRGPDGELRTMKELHKEILRAVATICDGNLDLTAKALDIGRSTMFRKRREDPAFFTVKTRQKPAPARVTVPAE